MSVMNLGDSGFSSAGGSGQEPPDIVKSTLEKVTMALVRYGTVPYLPIRGHQVHTIRYLKDSENKFVAILPNFHAKINF